jgi:hypothetical protein
MKSFKQLAVVAFFAALTCAGLHAQSLDMRANIPFDFHAGDRLMPAGEYVIHQQGGLVFLRGTDRGGPAPILMTIGLVGADSSRDARLDFKRYGSEYFLSAIWNPFSKDGRQVPQTARQKELAKRGDIPVPAEVTITSTK